MNMWAWKQGFRDQMRNKSCQWQWPAPGAQPSPVPPSPGNFFAYGMIYILKGILNLVFVFGILSLVMDRSLFGLHLAQGMNFWMVILVWAIAFNILLWPLTLMKRSLYYRGSSGPFGRSLFWDLGNFIVFIVTLLFALWAIDRFVPQGHALLLDFSHFVQQLFESLKAAWN